ELLLELSSGGKFGAPAPVLAVRAGTPSSFERRLSMILSDRVSGKVSTGGLLAVFALALVALPAWTLGQNPTAPPEVASPGVRLGERVEPEGVALHLTLADGISDQDAVRILRSLLPKACVAGLGADTAVNWNYCMRCHVPPNDPTAGPANRNDWK